MRIRFLTAHLYHRGLVLASILFLILRRSLRLGSCRDPQAVAIENAVLRHQLVVLRLWGSETPIIRLTCGFATRDEDERALFRMPGKRAIGLRYPLPLGTKP